MFKILLTTLVVLTTLSCLNEPKKNSKSKVLLKEKKTVKKRFISKEKKSFNRAGTGKNVKGIHPLWKIENAYPYNQEVPLKISAMAFAGDDLYVTTMSPDRKNNAPDKKGKLYKLSGLTQNNGRKGVKAELLKDNLYEPASVAIINGKIYVGEKHQIIRLEDKNRDGKFDNNETTILLRGTSQPNFHTFTVGFEVIEKNHKKIFSR